ncbi:unnamed protein product [Ilex paraguariensis]|uniref:Transcription initiation factor TFIID subunit 8 n=1 Tax=Ilex paraguariensis TaxID=185542 RepID=A0ABC8T0N0_9AQUA
MSDGGGESVRDSEHSTTTTTTKSKSDDFAQSIARIGVAQVCESAGFQSFQQSALDTFSDVAVRYIREIGKTANHYASLAGRTDCNMFDIIQGLEDLGSVQGFSGNSDVNHCLYHSGTVKEIVQYVGTAEEIPFAYSIPRFPVVKERKPSLSFEQVGEMPPGDHIPTWLPVFPDPETYTNLPSGNVRGVESQGDRIEKASGHRKVEPSLLNLQQRLASNGPEAPLAADPADAAKAKRAFDTNPFLAVPLQYGEKVVSSVVLPDRLRDEAVVQNNKHRVVENHASVLETFAPVIEAVKSGISDSEGGMKKVLLGRKPTLQFKFGTSKKFLGGAMNLRIEGAQRVDSSFVNDNGKDDKKRRAEQILKKSMEDPQELSQL